MPNSKRFSQLNRRIGAIEALYLPKTRMSGNYTKKEQDDLRAYLLLIHAELESYFEELCEEKAKNAFHKWKINRTKSNILISLVSFCDVMSNDVQIETRVNKALTDYIHKLRQNHGIKEKNILNLLLPIGLEYHAIDASWLNTITSFGTNRGVIAHTSAKVQNALDPVTLKTTITQIIGEIQVIDEKLISLK